MAAVINKLTGNRGRRCNCLPSLLGIKTDHLEYAVCAIGLLQPEEGMTRAAIIPVKKIFGVTVNGYVCKQFNTALCTSIRYRCKTFQVSREIDRRLGYSSLIVYFDCTACTRCTGYMIRFIGITGRCWLAARQIFRGVPDSS